MRGWLWCGLVTMVGWAGLQAQTMAETAPALRVALEKLEQAGQGKVRYTYLDRSHTQNFNEKGKETANFTQVFDVTYIGGLEYARLVEVDGKPLAGKALRDEQARFDAAVRDRSALDDSARAKLQHHVQKDAGIDLPALAASYRDAVAGRETVDGRECVVIAAEPGEAGGSKRYRLWLDPAREEIARLDFEQIADEGEMLRGAHGSKTWTYRDGTALATHSLAEATFAVNGKGRLRVVAEHSFSGFRRFSVTATMVPTAAP